MFRFPDLAKNNAKDITIRMFDYNDKTISVALKLSRNDENTENSYFSINGSLPGRISGSFSNLNSTIGFMYNQASLVVLDSLGNK